MAEAGTTPCGARACTGCRICGCPSLGIAALVAADPAPDQLLPDEMWAAATVTAPNIVHLHRADLAPEVARGVAEVKAEALREAADLLQFTADPTHVPTWLHAEADRILRDAEGADSTAGETDTNEGDGA